MRAHPLLFLLRCRFRNRIRSGLRKLKQPKFLIAAVLVVVYFAFVVATQIFSSSMRDGGRGPPAIASAAPVILLFLAGVAWVMPRWKKHHPLRFSQADVELLFSQPIRRRHLAIYALLSVQVYVLFSTVLLTLFISRSFSPRALLSWFIVLNIMHLYSVGIAFARGTPREAGLRRWVLAWLPGLVLGVGFVLCLVLAAPAPDRLFGPGFLDECKRIIETPGFTVLLAPFRCITTLVTARSISPATLVALAWTLVILVGHLGWILLQDTAFEEACVRGAETRAARLEAWRQGKRFFWRKGPRRGPVKRQPYRLAPTGPVVWAFVWKGLLSASRFWSVRNMALALPMAFAGGMGIHEAETRLLDTGSGIRMGLWIGGYAAIVIYSFILFRATQEGLGMIDSMANLKSLPLRGRTAFGGSVLAEFAVFMAIFGLMWAAAVGYIGDLLARDPVWIGSILAVSLAGMGVLVAVTSAVRLVTVLLLPFTAVRQAGPAGFGHNLVIMLVRMLAMLMVSILPGVAVGLSMLIFRGRLLTPHICIAVGAAVAALETLALVHLGGLLYDRFDVNSVTAT